MIAWSFLVFGLGAVDPATTLEVGAGQPVVVHLAGRSAEPTYLELAGPAGSTVESLEPGQTFHTVRPEEAGEFELRLLVGQTPTVVAAVPVRVRPGTTR